MLQAAEASIHGKDPAEFITRVLQKEEQCGWNTEGGRQGAHREHAWAASPLSGFDTRLKAHADLQC